MNKREENMKKLTKKEHDKLREDIITELKGKGFEIAMDKKRNIAIAYNEFLLFSNKNPFSISIPISIASTSIAKIRKPYLKRAKSTIEYGQNITHQETQKRIDLLENNTKATIEKLKDGSLFDYLPLTKQNKFNRNSNITLYKSDIKFTVNTDYFSQDEIALQLTPCIGNHIIFDDLAFLIINPFANLLNVLTPPIIDGKGVFNKQERARNSYIKMDDLVPGCIYKDAKGKLNLYIGEIKCKQFEIGIGDSHTYSITPYIKLTPKWTKILDACTNMNEFVYKVIEDAQKKGASDWFTSFNIPEKIKFTELESIRFSDNDTLIKIENCPYDYNISGAKFLLKIVTKN